MNSSAGKSGATDFECPAAGYCPGNASVLNRPRRPERPVPHTLPACSSLCRVHAYGSQRERQGHLQPERRARLVSAPAPLALLVPPAWGTAVLSSGRPLLVGSCVAPPHCHARPFLPGPAPPNPDQWHIPRLPPPASAQQQVRRRQGRRQLRQRFCAAAGKPGGRSWQLLPIPSWARMRWRGHCPGHTALSPKLEEPSPLLLDSTCTAVHRPLPCCGACACVQDPEMALSCGITDLDSRVNEASGVLNMAGQGRAGQGQALAGAVARRGRARVRARGRAGGQVQRGIGLRAAGGRRAGARWHASAGASARLCLGLTVCPPPPLPRTWLFQILDWAFGELLWVLLVCSLMAAGSCSRHSYVATPPLPPAPPWPNRSAPCLPPPAQMARSGAAAAAALSDTLSARCVWDRAARRAVSGACCFPRLLPPPLLCFHLACLGRPPPANAALHTRQAVLGASGAATDPPHPAPGAMRSALCPAAWRARVQLWPSDAEQCKAFCVKMRGNGEGVDTYGRTATC